MLQLTQKQVDDIAFRIANILKKTGYHPVSLEGKSEIIQTDVGMDSGLFYTIDDAVHSAQKAQKKLMSMTLAKRDEIILNIRTRMMQHVEDISKRAYEETGLGRVEDKVEKNRLALEKTPGTEILVPRANTGDRGLTLLELAPYGVIGAITPVTNPTSTIICNTIGMIAAGNSVVFNVHPSAKQVSVYTVELINHAIVEVGGPENLVNTLKEPTIESAQELMRHPEVSLLVVTGGASVVDVAMKSGKRSICAGPGNPPVVVDESANIDNAARCIVEGASMDNNIICVDEKEVLVVDSITDQLISALAQNNAIILNQEQMQRLEKVIFAEDRGPRTHAVVEKTLIGKDIQVILSKIGVEVESHIRLAVVEVDQDHQLVWTEQMMPIIPLVRMPDANSAIDLAKEVELGYRHTAVMHSKNIDNLSRMARLMDCSIFVKNGSALAGLGYGGEGYCSFSIASPTGEGITNPKSFSRERRCVLVDHFRIV